jgi:transcriptional regulator with XRE-family HTH domain
MAALLRKLRKKRGISLRQLADSAGVRPSVASRAERGRDAKLSTWECLFAGLGYDLCWDVQEISEEVQDLLSDEAERRREKVFAGLCAGKRRFY